MDFHKEMADVSKTFDFFLRLSEFMKFQLDEILPHYITKTKLNIPDRIRDESENLLFSITNFIKFVKTCKVEKVEPKKPDEPEYWPDMMFEMYKSIDDLGNVTKRGFYCGICNFVTFDTDVWNAHYKDDPIHLENDIRIKSGSNARVDGTYCKYCLGVFYSEVPHLEIIMNSKHHKYIDDLIIRKRNENSKNDQPKEEKPLRSSSVASINSAASMSSSVSSKQAKKQKKPPMVITNSNKNVNAKKSTDPKKEKPLRSSSVASINSVDSMLSVSSKQDKKQQKPPTEKSNFVSPAVFISSESSKPNKKSKKKAEKIFTSSHFDSNINSNNPIETKDCLNEMPAFKKPESDLINFSEAQNSSEAHNSSDPVEVNLNRLLQYKRENFDSFAGLCVECDSLVDGEFGWSSHIESHGDSNETQRCYTCNTGFYGNINLVKHTYLVHKIHTHVIHSLK